MVKKICIKRASTAFRPFTDKKLLIMSCRVNYELILRDTLLFRPLGHLYKINIKLLEK